MRSIAAVAAAFLGAAGSAQALAPDVTPRAGLRVAASAGEAEGRAVTGPAARIDAGVELSWLLESGVAIDAVLGASAEVEPGRAGWAPAATPPSGPIVSPASRLVADPAARRGDGRVALEQAYLAVRSGWGEVSVGRDVGVAARFSLPPPTILTTASAVDPLLDPAGLGGVRIRADLSGPSAKASVVSPRWLGVRLGASYTPRAEGANLDDAPLSSRAPRFEGRDIREAGFSFDRTWRSGLQTTVGVGWAAGAGGPAFGDSDMTSWGARLGRGDLSVGIAGRTATFDAHPGRETRSVGLGATIDRGAWSYEVSAARMRDQVAASTLRIVTLAGRKALTDKAALSVAATFGERVDGAGSAREKSRADGLKLEFSLDL